MSAAVERDDAAVVIINMQRHVDAANRLLLDRVLEHLDEGDVQRAKKLIAYMRDILKEPQ